MSEATAHQIAMSSPGIGEAGRTGDWRHEFPVITAEACLPVKSGRNSCQICWGHCPDNCITQGAPPTIDLTYCKGCGICVEVCPTDAIVMHPEAEFAVFQRTRDEAAGKEGGAP